MHTQTHTQPPLRALGGVFQGRVKGEVNPPLAGEGLVRNGKTKERTIEGMEGLEKWWQGGNVDWSFWNGGTEE